MIEVTDEQWTVIAKAAGEHGVRYRTNSSFTAFLAAVAPLIEAQARAEIERLTFQTSHYSRTAPAPAISGGDDPISVLRKIKALVCGDRNQRWLTDTAVTSTRGWIADLCDAALAAADRSAS